LLRHCCRFFGNNVAGFGNNVERNFVLSTKSKQIEHVAKNGNNVEATFEFVERTKFYNRIVRHCIVAFCGNKVERFFDNDAGMDGALGVVSPF